MQRFIQRNLCGIGLLASLLLCALVYGQQSGQPSGVASAGNRDQGDDTRVQDAGDAFLFLAGDVVNADGSALDEGHRAELICGGRVEYQTFVSASGRFTIELGKTAAFGMTDASVGRELADPGMQTNSQSAGALGGGTLPQVPFNRHNLSSCEVRLQPRAGYYSEGIRLGSRSSFDSPELGTIILHRLSEDEGTTVSLTTLEAPADAKRAFEKAQEELGRKRVNYSKAAKHLERAVEVHPHFAAAWELLGQTRVALKDKKGAEAALWKAIEADPRFMSPYLTLARLELYDQDWEAAAALTAKLMELKTRVPQAFYFHGVANFYLGEYEIAGKAFSYLEKSGHAREFPMSYLHLGIIRARQGDFPVAAKEFSRFLKYMPAEQVSTGQRQRIEQQLGQWNAEGAIDLVALQAEINAEEN